MKKLLWFRNSHAFHMVGDLLLPRGEAPYGTVIFAHGFQSNRKSPRNLAVAERLLDVGIASLLFDFTGHGESQGQSEQATLGQLVEDIGAAIDRALVENRIDAGRIGVAGSGVGGTAAILRAATDKRIKTLVLRNTAAGTLEVLEAADYVDIPTLLIVGDSDPGAIHENHALQFALVGETRLEIVPGADALFEETEQLRKVVEASADWFSHKLNVLTRA